VISFIFYFCLFVGKNYLLLFYIYIYIYIYFKACSSFLIFIFKQMCILKGLNLK
jgi:hypothetical protein